MGVERVARRSVMRKLGFFKAHKDSLNKEHFKFGHKDLMDILAEELGKRGWHRARKNMKPHVHPRHKRQEAVK